MKSFEAVINLLQTLKLSGMIKHLDELITDAERNHQSYIQFLNKLFQTEINERTQKRFERNMTGAHFPNLKRIESFDFGKIKGISKSEAVNMIDCRWIDKKENLLFFGPPGTGKTHLSIAFGINAIEKGYTVCFERVTNLFRLLKTSEIQKTSEYRIRRILKSNLVIIDEIGYTPIDKREANLFFNLLSELYEKSSVIVTSNKSFEDWAEMMGDEIMTTALLDRLLHHAHIFNLSGQSYRLNQTLKKKGENGLNKEK